MVNYFTINCSPNINICFRRKIMRHWKLQRISALILIPLTLWFIYEAMSLEIRNYTSTFLWFGEIKNIFLMVCLNLIALYHLALGLNVVIDDYVQDEKMNKLSHQINRLICSTLASFAIAIILFLFIRN